MGRVETALDAYCAIRNIGNMKNLTLKLDDAVLDRARHVAIDEHKSVSAWVQGLIVNEIAGRDQYEQDRKGAMMILKKDLHLGGCVILLPGRTRLISLSAFSA